MSPKTSICQGAAALAGSTIRPEPSVLPIWMRLKLIPPASVWLSISSPGAWASMLIRLMPENLSPLVPAEKSNLPGLRPVWSNRKSGIFSSASVRSALTARAAAVRCRGFNPNVERYPSLDAGTGVQPKGSQGFSGNGGLHLELNGGIAGSKNHSGGDAGGLTGQHRRAG